MTLNQDQFKKVLSLLDFFSNYSLKMKYLRFKPSYLLTYQGKEENVDSEPLMNIARARWNFAISAVVADVHEKVQRRNLVFLFYKKLIRNLK